MSLQMRIMKMVFESNCDFPNGYGKKFLNDRNADKNCKDDSDKFRKRRKIL